jgi:hypothetical protein
LLVAFGANFGHVVFAVAPINVNENQSFPATVGIQFASIPWGGFGPK